MSNFFADIGYKSVNHYGEQLCGDHVEVAENGGSTVVVLADGLGSGVKASILSTLTAKIISTSLSEGLSLEECVQTIAATLPIDSEKKVAYSTFSIIMVHNNDIAELIQYDNPGTILLRDGKNCKYPKREFLIDGKKITAATIRLHENDHFILMSDGCPNASTDLSYNYNWEVKDITRFMESFIHVGYTAKTLSTILVDECERLYGGKPIDDATACVVRIRKKEVVNLLFGPPARMEDTERMLSDFFSTPGRHIVSGGTTSKISAEFLHKPIKTHAHSDDPEVPPIAEIPGVDLVTEGVLTIHKVVTYARDYLGDNERYIDWGFKRDGASLICRELFEQATHVNLFIGRAVNPAHQTPDMPADFNFKLSLSKELSECLTAMGKQVTLTYY